MTTNDRKIAFENILLEHKDHFMRVTQLRDLLISSHDLANIDKAQLRRWVNSSLRAMEAKGRVKKKKEQGSNKWVYRLVSGDKADNNVNVAVKECDSTATDLENTLNELENQLIENQRSSRIYLSQLNTYKKIQKSYPALSDYAQTKYQRVFDESYDLLGQIKALEETLADHGRRAN